MPKIRVEVEVPSEAVAEGLDKKAFAAAVQRQAILELVRAGKLSQGRAAEILHVSRDELCALMSAAGVPHLNYPPADLGADATAARTALSARRR